MSVWIAAALLAAAAAGCASSGAPGNAVPSAENDGLVARKVRGLDEVFVRPGVSFKSYQTVQLDPLKVEFDKDWDPNFGRRDLNDMISDEDLQKMKDEMAREFRSVFVEELTAAGFKVVDQPATTDSLRLSPAIVDVIVNAPDPMHRPARTRTYTREAGEMTLQLEARDGPAGQVVARVTDEYHGRDTGSLELTNSVTNMADFRNAVRAWARQLRSSMKVADIARS
jgi:hypothetical protein